MLTALALHSALTSAGNEQDIPHNCWRDGWPSSAGLAEIAARGRDQLQELQASAEPSAAGRGESNGAPQPAETSAIELVRGREQWLYFVNPEQPVAGQRATIYFNNNVSDILRYMSPH